MLTTVTEIRKNGLLIRMFLLFSGFFFTPNYKDDGVDGARRSTEERLFLLYLTFTTACMHLWCIKCSHEQWTFPFVPLMSEG